MNDPKCPCCGREMLVPVYRDYFNKTWIACCRCNECEAKWKTGDFAGETKEAAAEKARAAAMHRQALADPLKKVLDERDAALAKVPKWISVEERLPEVQEHVLFCHMIGKDVKSVRTGYRSAFTPGRFYTTSGMGTDTVTHWMPLPKAAEEG